MLNKKGFTLIELLVAITILLFGIVFILSLIVFHFKALFFSQNRLVAAYLAQEGIEVIRNIREENYLKNQAWNSNISPGTSNKLDRSSRQFPDNTISQCNRLKFDANSGYNCKTGTETFFSREISVSVSGDQMFVTSTVSWTEMGVQKKFQVNSTLFNWKPQ